MVNVKSCLSYAMFLILMVLVAIILWFSFTNGSGHLASYYGNKQVDGQAMVKLENFDGQGHSVSLSYKLGPQKVLVTYPGATELLIELGLENRIRGTVAPYGREPIRYRAIYESLPKVSAPFVPTKEEVLDMEPDLIIAWSHHFQSDALGSIYNWFDRGIATYIVPATVRKGTPTIESTVYPFIDDMGRIFHVEDKAQSYKKSLENRVQTVFQQASKRSKKPSLMILQMHGKSLYSLYGSTYLINDVVEKAGGHNLISRQLNSVGPERVLAYDPDYIVLVNASHNDDQWRDQVLDELKNDTNLNHLRAVQEGHIIPVAFGDVNNGNGRVVDVLEEISRVFEEDL